jgi:hypothetical protein
MKRSISILVVAVSLVAPVAYAAATTVTVYKSSNCGCCEGWVRHLQNAGIETKVVNTDDVDSVKDRLGVPKEMRSCHTAVVTGTNQIIEGHVPATAVRKLVASPNVHGVAAPGMPMNSPGMGQMDGKLVTVDFAGKKFSQD